MTNKLVKETKGKPFISRQGILKTNSLENTGWQNDTKPAVFKCFLVEKV